MIDLKKMRKTFDEALEKESVESFYEWLNSKKEPKKFNFLGKGELLPIKFDVSYTQLAQLKTIFENEESDYVAKYPNVPQSEIYYNAA